MENDLYLEPTLEERVAVCKKRGHFRINGSECLRCGEKDTWNTSGPKTV